MARTTVAIGAVEGAGSGGLGRDGQFTEMVELPNAAFDSSPKSA